MWKVAPRSVIVAGVVVASALVGACSRRAESRTAAAASPPPPAATARTAPRALPAPAPPRLLRSLPEGCAEGDAPCTPPPEFVAELCRGKYSGVAILMFRQDQPWKHVFVKVREVFPVNVFAGPVTHVPLYFSEEVVVLRHRPYVPRPGYDMDNPDNYDVLRISGTCATLAEDQIRDHWAGPSSYAPLVWSWIEPGLRQALSGSAEIEAARVKQEDTCRGRTIGGGSPACQKASVGLVQAIMAEVNGGLPLPSPRLIPEWAPSTP